MANSKIYLGSTNIGSLFQGADNISIYLGDEKVYPLEEPVFQGKFKARYSGGETETYELACDGNTTLTTTNTKPTRYKYSAMTEAVIGDYCVTNIGSSAFYNCISLTSCTIGSGVTSIGNFAFYNCSGLTSIDIPSGITTINDGTFEGCSGLTSIDIPSGVTTISGSAFGGCSSLTSIDIPSGVTSIGGSAFSRCSSLTSVTINATTPPTLDGDFVFYSTNNCPIYVPSQSVETYKTATGWSEYSSRISAIPNS